MHASNPDLNNVHDSLPRLKARYTLIWTSQQMSCRACAFVSAVFACCLCLAQSPAPPNACGSEGSKGSCRPFFRCRLTRMEPLKSAGMEQTLRFGSFSGQQMEGSEQIIHQPRAGYPQIKPPMRHELAMICPGVASKLEPLFTVASFWRPSKSIKKNDFPDKLERIAWLPQQTGSIKLQKAVKPQVSL